MKLALCLYGQTRDYDKALPSWEKFIHKYQPDLYWHTWDSVPILGLFNYNLKEGIIKKYIKEDFDWITTGVTEYSSTARNVCPQIRSMNRSISLIKYDNDYDFIIRSRFDLVLHEPEAITFEYLDPSKYYVANNHWRDNPDIFDDNIMIGGSGMRKIGYEWKLYEYIQRNKVIPSGEQFISHLFKTKDVVRTDLLNFTLARNI